MLHAAEAVRVPFAALALAQPFEFDGDMVPWVGGVSRGRSSTVSVSFFTKK